ncbi:MULTISPECIES: DUF1365 domain-containing protein [Rhizobium]|jgi:DUF1365 family protein|uniref:DUF1365 domain-containing protein n=1 Tax=Rhizobium TaxID=379 RepID=UPI000DE23689|nr:DUF1365 domain-containing protein [Rhizobium leguminosarum]MBY2908206.1 DUF1365 domain-containing protein [Rhizobium leguminosarum]MBY2916029.1 DUF1365 domain-containing protein [Rhizobium leguminosarum]MBY2935412.1 DUF1365 domain-containing protein [Rhizobium leguminosarum]MBY2941273.1 DUF1365 domain-containing protein [Rhizobium leguminosarum]MBY2947979.1 DUF1365 domain-containing protein [Rhizobium leguminosarum]
MTGLGEKRGMNAVANGPPPDAAAGLYVGEIMHQRMKPFGHRFRYRVFSLLVDLDRLDEAGRLSMLFSVNGRNLVSFQEKDHAETRNTSLRAYADRLLAEAGLDRADRILLVCYPRILGYVFNPLSVYHAYDAAGAVIAMIYEVRNTFGERHSYVCPVGRGEMSESGLRQSCDKLFHVSPFIGMAARYHFRMLPPGKEIRWRILETDSEGPLLSATFSGRQVPLTNASLLGLTARIPILTFKIMTGIHWEALKLWLKGARYVRRPAPPPEVSVRQTRPLAEAAE